MYCTLHAAGHNNWAEDRTTTEIIKMTGRRKTFSFLSCLLSLTAFPVSAYVILTMFYSGSFTDSLQVPATTHLSTRETHPSPEDVVWQSVISSSRSSEKCSECQHISRIANQNNCHLHTFLSGQNCTQELKTHLIINTEIDDISNITNNKQGKL